MCAWIQRAPVRVSVGFGIDVVVFKSKVHQLQRGRVNRLEPAVVGTAQRVAECLLISHHNNLVIARINSRQARNRAVVAVKRDARHIRAHHCKRVEQGVQIVGKPVAQAIAHTQGNRRLIAVALGMDVFELFQRIRAWRGQDA